MLHTEPERLLSTAAFERFDEPITDAIEHMNMPPAALEQIGAIYNRSAVCAALSDLLSGEHELEAPMDNYFFSLTMTGFLPHVAGSDDAPLCYEAEVVERTRELGCAEPRVELRRGDLVTVGRSGGRSYDLVSTSNIIDWLDAEQRSACLSGLAEQLAPGGVLLIRQANYHRGAELYPLRESLASSGLAVDEELSRAARAHERSLFFGGLVPRRDNLLVTRRHSV